MTRSSKAILVGVLALAAAWAPAGAVDSVGAPALREREATLAPKLQGGVVFREPLYLESNESGHSASGDVYAALAPPFNTVAHALLRPEQWCDVLMLHLNVKRCEAGAGGLTLYVGSKHEQPVQRAQRFDLAFTVVARSADYLHVRMSTPDGPLGTRDCLFAFEATPSRGGGTFVHFQYGVGYSGFADLALRGYLATVGRGRVGFSTDPAAPGSTAAYVRGTRGMVERNAMRYYLAIVAQLDSLAAPEGEGTERRLGAWFDATERYALQLHEIDRDDYLVMKRHELAALAGPTHPDR